MAERDLYQALGVPRTATEAEIRKAYKELARKYHPDKNPGNKQAEERFKEASYAREVLQNKKKRALYDEFGEMGLKEGFEPDTYRAYRNMGGARGGRGPSIEDIFASMRGGGVPGGFGGFYDPSGAGSVEEMFSRGARRRAREQPVELTSDLALGFIDALRGGEREIQLAVPGESSLKSLRVRVPAGVKDGGQIRLRGQGVHGGDLVLRIHVDEHPFLRREGDDLLLNLPLTVGEAYRGAKVTVPTLEGDVTLTVPARSKSGSKLRLRGKGVKTSSGAGDLIAVLQVRVPESEDPAVVEAIDVLEKHYADNPRVAIKL
jgi:curved DNA-binding protein